MAEPHGAQVQHWTTAAVPASQRFDYFAEALSTAIVPMSVESRARSFNAAMSAIELGPVRLVNQTGTAHRSFRSAHDQASTGEHSYHLILNLASSWTFRHRVDSCLEPGDAVLADSRYAHDLVMPRDYKVVHLKFSREWLERWLPAPTALVGRRLSGSAPPTRALTSYISCLSPQTVVDAPLAPDLIAEQIGALLALANYSIAGQAPPGSHATLRHRILDCIVQRCMEPRLTAESLAGTLNLPVDVVHRCLAARGETFAETLLHTRRRIATRMLSSRSFERLTLDDIRERAGFTTVRAMNRALLLAPSFKRTRNQSS